MIKTNKNKILPKIGFGAWLNYAYADSWMCTHPLAQIRKYYIFIDLIIQRYKHRNQISMLEP